MLEVEEQHLDGARMSRLLMRHRSKFVQHQMLEACGCREERIPRPRISYADSDVHGSSKDICSHRSPDRRQVEDREWVMFGDVVTREAQERSYTACSVQSLYACGNPKDSCVLLELLDPRRLRQHRTKMILDLGLGTAKSEEIIVCNYL